MGEQQFKKAGEDDDNDFDAGFKIPETKSTLFEKEKRYNAHVEQQDEEDKEDKKKGKPKKKKRTAAICCCGNPHCRIGPFSESREGDAE